MAKEMLINTIEGQECRISVVDNGRLEELYIERSSAVSHVGNIYKGKVTNVESAIQAAFIDYGEPKNGFLHISDIHPDYFPKSRQSAEPVDRRRAHYDRPPIQDCLRRGQEVVVQMTKEGIGTKGPTMTTYLSIPGRLLVMMPGMSRLGVSKKIEDEELRAHARKILSEVKVPEGMGFIVRTAGAGKGKTDIQRDMNYLLRLWKAVQEQTKRVKAPAEIYQESDLVTRTIRDVYTNDIERVICDSEVVRNRVLDFLSVAVPRSKHTVELYTGTEGLYHDHGLEEELEKVYARHVELPSGGSIVIDQTEALVAIDVNSGRNRQHNDAEMTAFRTNQEAAELIARQLRLRDLGGLVVIDFIDMRADKNRRAVDRTFREAVKPDRAKTKILRINQFGLVEMTRQRLGPSLKSGAYRRCEACEGLGVIKSEESQALHVLRSLQRACAEEDVAHILVRATPSVAHHVNNHHRALIAEIEADADKTIIVQADATLTGEECTITCTNARGSEIMAPAQKKPAKKKRPARSGRKTSRDKQGQADEAAEARKDVRADQSQEPAEPEPDEKPTTIGEDKQIENADNGEDKQGENGEGGKKKRRRRGGRRRKRGRTDGDDHTADDDGNAKASQDKPDDTADKSEGKPVEEPATQPDKTSETSEGSGGEAATDDGQPASPKKSRRRGRRGRGRRGRGRSGEADQTPDATKDEHAKAPPADQAQAEQAAEKHAETKKTEVTTQPEMAPSEGQEQTPKKAQKAKRTRRKKVTPPPAEPDASVGEPKQAAPDEDTAKAEKPKAKKRKTRKKAASKKADDGAAESGGDAAGE